MVQYVPSGHDDSGNGRIEPPDARLNYRFKIQGGGFEPNRPREWSRGMLVALGTYGSGVYWPKALCHKVGVSEYPHMHLSGTYGARFSTTDRTDMRRNSVHNNKDNKAIQNLKYLASASTRSETPA